MHARARCPAVRSPRLPLTLVAADTAAHAMEAGFTILQEREGGASLIIAFATIRVKEPLRKLPTSTATLNCFSHLHLRPDLEA